MARTETHSSLSSVGRKRIRPRAIDIPMLDFHTHNLNAPAGEAIISLPREAVLSPADFAWRDGALYSAGIHPWWTDNERQCLAMLENIRRMAEMPQVVSIGECGFDRLRGDISLQKTLFAKQAGISENVKKPMIIHCVRAFDILLAAHKTLRPTQTWTVHGFRGHPALAKQLLDAGMDLSFGSHFNAAAFDITPPARRHRETDEDF